MNNEELLAEWSQTMQNTYGAPSIALVSGKGLVVKDADGKSYLDFLGGIATNVLGIKGQQLKQFIDCVNLDKAEIDLIEQD